MKKLTALVLMLALTLTCITGAFATAYPSGNAYYDGVGVTYKVWSTLYQDTSNSFRASVWISTEDLTKVPANHMSANAELVDFNGDVIIDSGWLSNSISDYWLCAVTDTYNAGNQRVCSRGQVKLYNGVKNVQYTAPESVYKGGSRVAALNLMALKSTLDSDGSYPKTTDGKTYGSIMLAGTVGCEPDLISAKNADGLRGYIKYEDLNPEINSETDYKQYRAALEANDYKVPMYDLQGNVIGSFDICKGESIVPGATSPEEVRKALDAEMGGNQPLEAGVELEAAIAALDSPYNDSSYCDDTETISPQTAREHQISLWLVNGEYRKTASGKTYGSTMMFDVVGYNPDLISVQNKDRLHGYVKNEDLNPEINGEADYMQYRATLEANGYKVPMYDLEENIIGYFDISKSVSPFG